MTSRSSEPHGLSAVVDGRAEQTPDPVGLGVAEPRLSWRIEADMDGTAQTAYQLQVATGAAFATPECDTGWIESSACLDRPWPAEPLDSRQHRWWRVRARTTTGETGWSDANRVEAGLLRSSDWAGHFIGVDTGPNEQPEPCPLLRRSFHLDEPVESARLYVTALGFYEIEINGTKVGDELLAPGWTSYRHRLVYRTHDVGRLLTSGENVIGATLADGWYRGYLGWDDQRGHYGDELALLAQLEIDGSRTVATDDAWRASTGAIRFADLYRGEEVDESFDQPGWSQPGFDDTHWAPVRQVVADLAVVTAASAPAVRAMAQLRPSSIDRRPDGSLIVDFGQNLVGHVSFTVEGSQPRRITARHAEILWPDGSLRTDLLRSAIATDTLVTTGNGPVRFEPRFTFHGFRYAEIVGAPELGIDDITAVAISSGLDDIGQFECSVPELDRLHANTRWSLRGNFVSLPTDCPQRDERLGWTGDAQVFAPTAAFLVDAGPFLTSWLADVVAEQREDGAVPWTVPNIIGTWAAGAAGWGDVITCMPHDLYTAIGDPASLALTFDAMRRWVDYMLSRAGADLIWAGDFQFGDWLDPDAPAGRPADAKADRDLVATAYMVRSLELVGRAAEILGRTGDAARYRELAEQARGVWWDRFGDEAATTQTGASMALLFGLAPSDDRSDVGARLHKLVEKADGHLATGFLGTPLLCAALVEAGYVEDAYTVLLQRTPPSWLYPITQGATTIWERWDALRPDGTVPTDPLAATKHSMVSFNHYAYGAVADFLHRTVAGLAPDPDPALPGYRRVLIEPRPGGGVIWARARHASRYGPVEVGWRIAEGWFDLDVTLPPSTTGRVRLPDGKLHPAVPSGRHQFRCRWPALT